LGEKSLSPLLATIILIAITFAGGLAFYGFLSGWIGRSALRVEVQIVSVDLVKTEDKTLFIVSVKNTGDKSLTRIDVSGIDDDGKRFSITLPQAEPGETLSDTLILSTDLYRFTVGNSYLVTVTAYSSDGDIFTKTFTVVCSSASP